MAPEQSPLAERRASALRGAVEAIRDSAAAAGLVALTYDHVAAAAEAAGDAGLPGAHRQRAAWARQRAAEERRNAARRSARAAALASAAD